MQICIGLGAKCRTLVSGRRQWSSANGLLRELTAHTHGWTEVVNAQTKPKAKSLINKNNRSFLSGGKGRHKKKGEIELGPEKGFIVGLLQLWFPIEATKLRNKDIFQQLSQSQLLSDIDSYSDWNWFLPPLIITTTLCPVVNWLLQHQLSSSHYKHQANRQRRGLAVVGKRGQTARNVAMTQ